MDFRTRCAQGERTGVDVGRPLAAPIVSASTVEFDSQNGIEAYYSQGRGYLYLRYENPTVRCAEKALAALEGAAGFHLVAEVRQREGEPVVQ